MIVPYNALLPAPYSVLVLSPLRSNSQVVFGAVNDGDNFLSNFLYLSPA